MAVSYSGLARPDFLPPSPIDYSYIIFLQRNLHILHLHNCDTHLGRMIDALKPHADSLRELYFNDCDFSKCTPWWGLANCRKLEKLEFLNCNNIKFKMVVPFFSAYFPELQSVQLLNENSIEYNICFEFQNWVENFWLLKVPDTG